LDAAVSFVSSIRQFEAGTGGHPEFAILRPSDDDAGSRHEAHQRAAFVDADGKSKWVDRGGLTKFNHRHHLDPAGVLDRHRKAIRLACADCHVSGDDGYMLPNLYEQHCRKCHPLTMASVLRENSELPHSTIEEVRGVIRERLARQIEIDALGPKPTSPDEGLPRLPLPTALTKNQELALAESMKKADHAVFGFEAKGACRHCHHLEQRGDDWHVHVNNPALEGRKGLSPDGHLEMVPARWLPHARFDHASHRAVDCTACHDAPSSTETTDILMPSIAVCRTCHGDDARSAATRVSADCVLCHTYHGEAHGADFQGVPLDKLFPTTPEATGAPNP
jgi:predicted CXXCH cytochrome family protein